MRRFPALLVATAIAISIFSAPQSASGQRRASLSQFQHLYIEVGTSGDEWELLGYFTERFRQAGWLISEYNESPPDQSLYCAFNTQQIDGSGVALHFRCTDSRGREQVSLFETSGSLRAWTIKGNFERAARRIIERLIGMRPNGFDPVQPEPVPAGGTGTAFIVSSSGLLLTAHHVVDRATSITISCNGRAPVVATVTSSSPSVDLAVLTAESSLGTNAFLRLSHQQPRLGDEVFTIGYPTPSILGRDPKYTNGTVSALSGFGGDASYLQISVPVQPGNSGGPLVNQNGEVIGVVVATADAPFFIRATESIPQNINFAVKSVFASALFTSPTASSSIPSTDVIARVTDATCLVEASNNPSTPRSASTNPTPRDGQTDRQPPRIGSRNTAPQQSLRPANIGTSRPFPAGVTRESLLGLDYAQLRQRLGEPISTAGSTRRGDEFVRPAQATYEFDRGLLTIYFQAGLVNGIFPLDFFARDNR